MQRLKRIDRGFTTSRRLSRFVCRYPCIADFRQQCRYNAPSPGRLFFRHKVPPTVKQTKKEKKRNSPHPRHYENYGNSLVRLQRSWKFILPCRCTSIRGTLGREKRASVLPLILFTNFYFQPRSTYLILRLSAPPLSHSPWLGFFARTTEHRWRLIFDESSVTCKRGLSFGCSDYFLLLILIMTLLQAIP